MTSKNKLSTQHEAFVPGKIVPTVNSGPVLRQRAEAVFLKNNAQSSENLDVLSPEATRQMLHELQVHQIELEMQNEELRRSQTELDAARSRYFDLYDLAPVGYCSVSEIGLILQANLTAATLLGVARGALVQRPFSGFISKEDQGVYHLLRKQLFETGEPQVCDLRMLKLDGTQFWVHLVATAAQDADGAPVCRVVLTDIDERKHNEHELIESKERIQRQVVQLQSAFMSTVEVATSLSERRDPYTAGHERRVGKIAAAIGAELGLGEHDQEGLRVAGYLHDIGKITIPAEILSKPGKLSLIEFKLIQGHAQSSYEVLKDVKFPWPVAQVALQHHERMDGSGYPQGLKGEAILFEARILAVADVVEAMSSHRPYRAGLGVEAAMAEIEAGKGTRYDSTVAGACLKLFREKGYTIPA
jgi:PAS domain S-box-containing protein/putative nucleotidyltransferase with HDIG domain